MINILMSTYNGAEFISAQLDSICSQSYSKWQLYVRDDGSTDNTRQIVEQYASTDSRIHLLPDDHLRLGAMQSFEQLLSLCGDAPYLAFADQDDVWNTDKLQVCYNHITQREAQIGQSTPIVVHTDLTVVDHDLNTIAESFWQYSNLHPQLIESNIHYLAIANCLTGCTMLLNQACRQASLPFYHNAYMHDAWIGLSTMLNNGEIIAINQPTMLYRQHQKNTLGALEYQFTLGQWKWKWFLAKRSYTAAKPYVFKNIAQFIYWKIRYFIALHGLKK